MLYVYYAVIAVILFAGVKFAGVKGWNDQFMSLQESKAIQAICAILIIFHHMSQQLEGFQPIQIFVDAGILFVGVFLFCSGYGLIKSLESKENYLDHFLKKRLITVLVPFYLINTIYVIYSAVMGQFDNLSGGALGKELFVQLSGIKIANGNEWFMIAIAFIYIFFYIFFKYFNQVVAFILMGIVLLAYSGLGLYLDHGEWWLQGEWWYNTILLFYVGLLFAKFEKQLLAGIHKVYYLLLPVVVILFAVAYHYSVKVLYAHSYWCEYDQSLSRKDILMNRSMSLGMQILAVLLFVFAVLLIMMKLHFNNPVLNFIGKISLEIYLIHDLFLQFYHSENHNLINATQFVSAILVSTFVSAFILWFVSNRMNGFLLKKRR